ncbi:hypothetical protein GWK47_009789 [Chionoecetes opilio]|uniref:Uncharacterized protein n=1 Tax=Chionoecetes opilio TaxID=41210 RepID=A0A8J4Y2V1_CHIOP|nr:hypothetical protein GWK47_009789 [Chionoecetes opilio]
MPRPPNMPTDKHSAREIMKMFSEMAYATSHKDIFEKAIPLLQRHEQRDCLGTTLSVWKSPKSLQMVEEYVKVPGHKRYYKCNLCGAHGKLESIYKHLIGSRHTEKYIRLQTPADKAPPLTSLDVAPPIFFLATPLEGTNDGGEPYVLFTVCHHFQKLHVVLKNSILTAKEREFIRESLIKKEGIPVSAIKTYKEKWLYPLKWERCNPSGSSSKKRLEAQRASAGTSQSPFSSKPSSTSSPDRSSKSPLSMFRNQSPPRDNEMNTDDGQQAAAVGPPETREVVMMQDQYTQNYDLEELMIQFNFIVKTSNSPEFDIRNQEDAKAALDMMFKISSALHFITKNKIESAGDKSQPSKEDLIHKKNLLTKIMGNIKLRMEPALLGKHGT